MMERSLLLRSNTGSWNYNLHEEGSDKDYKAFVAPTFEDLYTNNMYHKSIITSVEDHDIHDIRKLPELLYKSNIAYMELLFSDDIFYSHDYYIQFKRLLGLAGEIAKINLPSLFRSTGGMFNQRMKKLDHATDGTRHLVEAHGWNTKEGMHTFRTLNLLVRYEANGFNDFKSALKYSDEERNNLLKIKNGEMTKDEFIKFITNYHDHYFAPLKDKFLSYEPNIELKEAIEEIVMDVVGQEVGAELYLQSH